MWHACEYDKECLGNQDTNFITKEELKPASCVIIKQWNRGTTLELAH